MRWLRWTTVSVAVLLCMAHAASPGRAVAQDPPKDTPTKQNPAAQAEGVKSSAEQGLPSKSAYGKLERVDASLNGVIMRSDDGARLAWKFDPPVIAELAKFKPGDPMIVVYRQTSRNEKRVTAVAFPGTASSPTYLNLTGFRILMRSGPAVNGKCGDPTAAPVTETMVPNGGMAEALDSCWCCASDEQTCTPGNRTGQGKAVLVNCFK